MGVFYGINGSDELIKGKFILRLHLIARFLKRRIAKKKVRETIQNIERKYCYMHFATGTFHQGDTRFSAQSRSLSAMNAVL